MIRALLPALWLGACLLRPASAAPTLEELVSWQRTSWPAAAVTSGFFDWREASRYRAAPGLHAGYDVAMPAGARALAAWPGRVTAVTPWWSLEHGVTVEHPEGWTATYGHLIPTVRVGEPIRAGQPLGIVAVDHLDVKIRDRAGQPIDFGRDPGSGPARARQAAPSAQARWAALELRLTRALGQTPLSPLGGLAESGQTLALQREAGLISEKEARALASRLSRGETGLEATGLPTAEEVTRARQELEAALGGSVPEPRVPALLSRRLDEARDALARIVRLEEAGAASSRSLAQARARLRQLEALAEAFSGGTPSPRPGRA